MIRFYNGRVLSFSGGLKISDAEVWTDGGVITHVGAAKEDMPAFEREIDLKGDLLIPGFKDAHTHTAMTFLRSFADDMPLDRWLSEQVWPNEAKLTDESVYIFTQLGIMEYLSSGITASFDMYVHNEAYAKANIDSGFRTVICSGLNNFDRDVENIEREYHVSSLNILNTTASNLYLRRQEFAQLRAIGVSVRELRKMVMLEGVISVICANIVGDVLGFAVMMPLAKAALVLFMVKLTFPIIGAVIGFVLSVLVMCGSIYIPMKRMSNQIADDLNAAGD